MGQAISAARKEVAGIDEEAKKQAKLDLEVLTKAVDSQLNEFEAKLDANFLNPLATSKIEVPGIRALRKTRFSKVGIKGEPNDMVSGAVDDFFSIGNAGVGTGDALKNGFKKIVTGALEIFLGKTDVGEFKENKYFVYMMHNAVVRLDVMLWRWNFTGKGFSNTHENALGYVICTSIVDVTSLKTSEFVFLISEYAGDGEDEVLEYTKKMEKLYNAARALKKGQQQMLKPVSEVETLDD
ncbi:unnamed protein product [Discula destructiva]